MKWWHIGERLDGPEAEATESIYGIILDKERFQIVDLI